MSRASGVGIAVAFGAGLVGLTAGFLLGKKQNSQKTEVKQQNSVSRKDALRFKLGATVVNDLVCGANIIYGKESQISFFSKHLARRSAWFVQSNARTRAN